jgi:ABC-type bacteriocin/lantibiotic exporter with double-glycine peptidase domain
VSTLQELRRDVFTRRRRLLAPEVIQTSTMDCGPAALKCLLDGFHIPASYGRLREACQTSVDGTSIDVIETVAGQLGLDAEQVMLPADYLALPEAKALPALVVVNQADGSQHFVILWQRIGRFVQVMDPGRGRRWLPFERFAQELFIHHYRVPGADWYDWATSDENRSILVSRLCALGATPEIASDVVRRAQATGSWQPMALLDAGTRMLTALVAAGGLPRGVPAVAFLEALLARAMHDPRGAFRTIPDAYWSTVPADDALADVYIRGAVLLRIRGRNTPSSGGDAPPLAPELAAALEERTVRPLRELWSLVRQDGLLTPLALLGALGLAAGALAIEALLLRGSFELAANLNLTSQRLWAVAALVSFVAILWALEFPLLDAALRLGRRLETRLRLALFRKLPRLSDRYFQSRPISDVAGRGHSIHAMRGLPDLASRSARCGWDLLLTLVGIACIDTGSVFVATLIALAAVGLPILAAPTLNERDMRLRSHNASLHTFNLDALLGIVPIRTHSAERSVRREYESRLVEWARASRSSLVSSLLIRGVQSLVCLSLAAWLLLAHVRHSGVSGELLLLTYWVLKLPALGETLATLGAQYPAYRNIALRLLEPLKAPEATSAPMEAPVPVTTGTRRNAPYLVHDAGAVAIELRNVAVVASGHTILRDVTLGIRPGEHVAIVGPSGAGKSSLLGLLLGWHQPAAGSITIDGDALTAQRLQQLRATTAWLDPAVQLWRRTLLDNLRYSSNAGAYDALGALLDNADLATVLTRLPNGLQSMVADGGASLSGGEGQRVRLARAMWQDNVRLALLDEPFRGLDREQRQRHLTEVRRCWRDATLLCVTHDVRETRAFHRVLVVDDGRIVEDGRPEDLIATVGSRYRALLDVEESLRHGLWNATLWRRIRLDAGRAHEANRSVATTKSVAGNE